MSFIRPILRICAVGALRDETWAEDRVFDSDNTPLAEAVFGQASKPYIVVYTDLDEINPVDRAAHIYDGMHRTVVLTIEIGVASALREDSDDPTSPIIVQFAATDEGMEIAVDMIETQVLSALIGQPKSEWGELFKTVAMHVKRIPSRRGGQAERGVRFAARQLRLIIEPINEPVPGFVPSENHYIRKFINLARAMPQSNVIDAAGIIESMLFSTEAPNWKQAQSFLGTTDEGAKHLHLPGSPLPVAGETPPLPAQDTNEYPPGLADITVDDLGGLDPDDTPGPSPYTIYPLPPE